MNAVSGAPPRLREILDIDLPRIVVLDVGAMREGEDRYAALLEQDLASVVGFEPQAAQLDALLTRKPATHHYLPYFLGRGEARTFYVTRYPGCSSLYEPDPAVIDLFATLGTGPDGNYEVVDRIEVETKRLDDIDECPPPDYVKIDVQGGELDVLDGGAEKLRDAVVIETETEFVPLYKEQPLFADVQTRLGALGFYLHKLVDVGGRTFRPVRNEPRPYRAISQLLWADAVFVRRFTDLAALSDTQLLKAALVLHEVYRSFDLVIHLLGELDRRQNSALATRYANSLGKTEVYRHFMTIKDWI